MKGLGRGGVQELQEFTEATFGSGAAKAQRLGNRVLYRLQSGRFGASVLLELLELLPP